MCVSVCVSLELLLEKNTAGTICGKTCLLCCDVRSHHSLAAGKFPVIQEHYHFQIFLVSVIRGIRVQLKFGKMSDCVNDVGGLCSGLKIPDKAVSNRLADEYSTIINHVSRHTLSQNTSRITSVSFYFLSSLQISASFSIFGSLSAVLTLQLLNLLVTHTTSNILSMENICSEDQKRETVVYPVNWQLCVCVCVFVSVIGNL